MTTYSRLAAGVALGALLIAAPIASKVFAADVFERGGGSKDVEINKVDFRGFYVGLGAGTEFVTFESEGANGFAAEAIAGYDVRLGSFVFGPRAIGGFGSIGYEVGGSDLATIDAYLNLGGRAGVVFNRTLVYIHGGYEMVWASSDNAVIDAQLDDADLNAATVGLGLETMFGNGISFTLEGTYISGLDDAKDAEAGRAVGRLNYRF